MSLVLAMKPSTTGVVSWLWVVEKYVLFTVGRNVGRKFQQHEATTRNTNALNSHAVWM
jgi:hypothetical protein